MPINGPCYVHFFQSSFSCIYFLYCLFCRYSIYNFPFSMTAFLVSLFHCLKYLTANVTPFFKYLFIYLFIFRIYSHHKFTIPTWIYGEIFSHFIVWKAGDHYLVIAHKFNMLCVGIFLQNEHCEDIYLIFRLVQYIIKSGVFSLHILLFCSDTTILCFPLVIGELYISSPLVSYS